MKKDCAQVIRELREDNDLTQKEIASILEIQQQSYSRYENYKIEIPLKLAVQLSDFYNVSMDYITGRSPHKNPAVNLKDLLNTNFNDNTTMGNLVDDLMYLTDKEKKSLIEYIDFLKYKRNKETNK